MSKPKLLADENIPKTIIDKLRGQGYDVLSLLEIRPGMSDDEVVDIAMRESRIILTFDKDFGRIALLKPEIPGVVLLRIPLLNPAYILKRIVAVLENVEDLYGKLVVVRKRTLRIIKLG